MEDSKLTIYCENDSRMREVAYGTSLGEIAAAWYPSLTDPGSGHENKVLSALVDNKVRGLDYKVYDNHNIRFLSYLDTEGRRTYIRSLCLVLQEAVSRLHKDRILRIEHSLPSGLYGELVEYADGKRKPCFLMDDEVEAIYRAMKETVAADLPLVRRCISTAEAVAIYNSRNQTEKARLAESLGQFWEEVYELNGYVDNFHGPLVPSTGCLDVFGLSPFNRGFCLQLPQMSDASALTPMKRQSKIASALEHNTAWGEIVGIKGLGSVNKTIAEGNAVKLINLEEARHEREYAAIADMVYSRRGQVKFIFIAGPSSSGKTSSSLRIAQQCKILGMNPKVIELDNYFVNREDTPRDENGEYDYEALQAMDLDHLNSQLNALIEGHEVETPIFDFKLGRRAAQGRKLRLEENDILIMEGIHALNPEMTCAVDSSRIFRVYVSALTSLNLDENNNISSSDNRLLRRMVRDNRTRGVDPEGTILRWPSVRRGENRNIFPFQENCDVIFNSATIFELPMLKYYAEPLLRRIAPNSPAYPEAQRMLTFLGYISALQPSEIASVPPASIMREFIGGQTL